MRGFPAFTGLGGHFWRNKDKAALWTDGRYFIQAGRQLGQRHLADAHGPARRAHSGMLAGRNTAAGRYPGGGRLCVNAAMVKRLRGAF